ncbi:MAG: hypothetical protein HY554_03685 [Elusimicrobia bacterium]|nr:hypothetical protein [Elusimicrobiota bacterium]
MRSHSPVFLGAFSSFRIFFQHKQTFRRLLTGLVAAAAWAAPAGAAQAPSASREVEAKVALENSLERRIETVLREVLGSQEIVVIVNAEMISESERKAVEIMPGVPPKEFSAASAPLAIAPTLVRRLSATVFVDRGIKDSDRDLARKTVARLLGVPADSDAVSIEATAFRRPAPLPERKELLAWALPAAWLLLASLGFALYSARFLSPVLHELRDAAAALRERAAEPAGGGRAAPAAAGELPGSPLAALAGPHPIHALAKDNAHFSFIQERDLQALSFLLSRDATSAAIVLNYLPAGLAARFLDLLPSAVRQETAGLMSQTRLLNKHQVAAVEEGLRERLQYLMGGESRLAEILDGATVTTQRELIEALRERDPETAERVTRRIVMLEDLASLGESEFRTLSRAVTVRSLATVLASSPDLREQVLPRLTGGVAEWLVQEVELCGALSSETIELEQRRVLTALSQAVRDGKIVLRKRLEESRAEDAGPAEPALEGPPMDAEAEPVRGED